MTGLVGDGIGEVWRYDGGTKWTRVGTDLNVQVCALTVFDSNLYAGTGNLAGAATLYRYDGGTNWTDVAYAGFPWLGFRSLYVWSNAMYLGSLNGDCFGRRFYGTPFVEDYSDETGSCIWDIQDYNGTLYAGADFRRLYKLDSLPGNWSLLLQMSPWDYGQGLWELEKFGEWLFIGDGPRLQRYNGSAFIPPLDSPIWTAPDDMNIIAMYTDGSFLILGTGGEAGGEYHKFGAGRIYRYDGTQVKSISGNLGAQGIQCLIRH